MELHQLRYFHAAAECSSFSKAAKRCFTSRQNIAHSVSALESELGFDLFDRKGNTLKITALGMRAASLVDDILADVDMLQHIDQGAEDSKKTLNVMATYNTLSRTPEAAETFMYQFDHRIHFVEAGCEDCYFAVCDGEVDAALVMCMRRDFPLCCCDEVQHLKAYAIVNSNSPVASKEALTIDDLSKRSLQIMSGTAFQNEPLFEDLVARDYDFSRISVATTSSSLYGIKRNEAIGIATGKFTKALPAGMRAIPLADYRYDWRIYILYPKELDRQSAVLRFVQGLRDSFWAHH